MTIQTELEPLSTVAEPLPTVAEPLPYIPWTHAGGPNECAHGYAEGIPCPDCDRAGARIEKRPRRG